MRIPVFCHIPGGGDLLICHVWAHLESRDPEYRANKLLMSAAPELLAVVEKLTISFDKEALGGVTAAE
jgi:hypothetical protein